MRSDLRITAVAVVVLVVTVDFVAGKARSAPRAPAGRIATIGEARYVATAIATEEPGWRNKSEESFPGDHWSQRDDFHAQERDKAKDLASSQKLPIEQVLRAIDEDVRASRRVGAADPRGAKAVPCKPRPVYD